MSPEYFHSRLTFGEADDYLGGMQRRYWHGYSQARMVEAIIGQLFSKNYKPQTFPWEKPVADTRPPSEEELASIMADAAAWEAELNGNNK